jgi:hypothetical protein
LADIAPDPPPDNPDKLQQYVRPAVWLICRDVSAIFSLPNKKQYRTKPAKTEQDHATVAVEKIGP